MELWQTVNLLDLLQEALTIQRNSKSLYKVKTIHQISIKFAEKMQKGNGNGVLKLVTNNMQYRILPLNEETVLKLKTKHPQAVNPEPEVLLPDGVPNVHPIRFEIIPAEDV